MPFLTEPEPIRGICSPVLPGIARILAPNPGPMTYHGTNTYLIDTPGGTVVLDPGPDNAAHVQAILAATGGHVRQVLLTHTHHDHVGAWPALRAATGARVAAFVRSADPNFAADRALHDGDEVEGFTALYTPGHAADHVCFARPDGVVFSGDHVMSWSKGTVSPPRGDMAAYFASLERLLRREDRVFLPGHGPPLENPAALVQEMLEHRRGREAAIEAALHTEPRAPAGLVDVIYTKLRPNLRAAAERNVLAHLLKLQQEGRAVLDGEVWRPA